MVQSHSSYLEYQPAVDAAKGIGITFQFKLTNTTEAYDEGLFLYSAMEVYQGSGDDFIAVAMYNRSVLLAYNLGSGSVTISSDPIDRSLEWHSVTAGRLGRDGYLYVDNQQRKEGQSPKPLVGLNLNTPLYVGGVPAEVQLPNTVAFTRGLQGAVYGLAIRFRESDRWQPFIKLLPSKHSSDADSMWPVKTGRGVGQHGHSPCNMNMNACRNGGMCVQQGSTFFCQCQGNWTGLYCADRRVPCYDYSPCAAGSVCHPDPQGFGLKCDCPFGKSGTHCDQGRSLVIHGRYMKYGSHCDQGRSLVIHGRYMKYGSHCDQGRSLVIHGRYMKYGSHCDQGRSLVIHGRYMKYGSHCV